MNYYELIQLEKTDDFNYYDLCHTGETTDITHMVVTDLKSKIEHGFGTKEDLKAWNIFNRDLVTIIAYEDTWWFETHSRYTNIPNYFIKWCNKFCLKHYNITSSYKI